MKNIALFSLFLLAGILPASAQYNKDAAAEYFSTITAFPDEKLYLHLDKPYYAAGESIWWKGYLTDAVLHLPTSGSNFIYLELINQNNEIVVRKKFKREKDDFHGNLSIPADIPPGFYYLRGYTRWMMNNSPDFFYSRQIRIGNLIDRSIQSAIRYTPAEKADRFTADIQFTDESGKPIPDVRVEVLVNTDNKKPNRHVRRTNQQGEINIDFTAGEQKRTIDVKFMDDAAYRYSRTFYVPLLGTKTEDFALTFFPEGGDLLADCLQRIAFKAQATNGLSCDVSGYLMTASGDTLVHFRTEHDGMGVLYFSPDADTDYQVLASRDGVNYHSYPFPKAKSSGIQLSATTRNRSNEVHFSVLKPGDEAITSPLYLIAHTRGDLCAFIEIPPGSSLSGKFSKDMLNEGISELILADGDGIVLSRRLVFKYPTDAAHFTMEITDGQYGRREKVSLPFWVMDGEGNPIQSNFSVSVTDRRTVTPDPLSDNICSSLLLTSDLKGFIENPGYYFLNRNDTVDYHVELLLLTHGWSRFSHDNVAKHPAISIDYPAEHTQAIHGKATTGMGRNAKEASVILFSPQVGIGMVDVTDEEGYFLFNDLNYQDSIQFNLQATGHTKWSTILFNIYSFTPPAPYSVFPFWEKYNEKQFLEYDNAVRNSYFNDGGMPMIRLNEVVVTAMQKKEEGKINPLYVEKMHSFMEKKRIEQSGAANAFELLRHFPGVSFHDGYVVLRGGTSAHPSRNNMPLVVIDDMYYFAESGMQMLSSTPVNQVENIGIIHSSRTAIFGSLGANGVIVVNLTTGSYMEKTPAPGLATFTSLGYTASAEFYHPVYETPEQKENPKQDIRTTLYWNPSLSTDEEGDGVIEFYTPDNLIQPHIVIEGITQEGYPIHWEQIISLNAE